MILPYFPQIFQWFPHIFHRFSKGDFDPSSSVRRLMSEAQVLELNVMPENGVRPIFPCSLAHIFRHVLLFVDVNLNCEKNCWLNIFTCCWFKLKGVKRVHILHPYFASVKNACPENGGRFHVRRWQSSSSHLILSPIDGFQEKQPALRLLFGFGEEKEGASERQVGRCKPKRGITFHR